MRHVILDDLKPSEAWEASAVRARGQIENGQRKPAEFAELWRALREQLEKLSDEKCFYCEVKLIRAPYDVDHFRPKSLYGFLALAPSNFRLACQHCNRRRKRDEFPLLDNSPRASRVTELDHEQPALLDPCNATDPGLLGFKMDGTACAARPDDPVATRRADQSIELYSLNEVRLIEARNEIKNFIARQVAAIVRSPREAGGPVGELLRCIRHDSEFTVFARMALKTHRGNPWVEQILDTA